MNSQWVNDGDDPFRSPERAVLINPIFYCLMGLCWDKIRKRQHTAKRKWPAFLGLDVPPTQPCGDYAVTRTEYEGNPAPEANSLLAFFDVGPDMQIEPIQPMVGQSLCFHKPYVKNLVKI